MRWHPFKSIGRPTRRPIRRTCRLELETLEDRLVFATSILSYHYDPGSTGRNLSETQLTRADVNSATFGKLFQTPVDGQVYAETLVDTGVNITTGANQGVHDVVFVATQHDSLYAIDAANPGAGNSGVILWQRSFLDTTNPNDHLPGASSVTSVPSADTGSNDITVEIGITSTPVIDPGSNTIYVVTKTKEMVGTTAHWVQRLHAINIADGTDRVAALLLGDTSGSSGNYTNNTPVVVGTAATPATGVGNDGNGHIYFNALVENQREALALVNGTVYIGWSSHGDLGLYHGWIVGANAATLSLKVVFNTTPNADDGAIWESGGTFTADAQGNLYVATGNGGFDGFNGNTGNTVQAGTITGLDANAFPVNGDYGDSVLKLAVDSSTSATNQGKNGWGLKVVDYFTPFNQYHDNAVDADLGSGGVVALPDAAGSPTNPHLLIAGGKQGKIYLIDRDNMGKYGTSDSVVQEVSGQVRPIFDTPAYYNGALYYVGNLGPAESFSIANAVLGTTPASKSSETTFGVEGSTPVVSANGVTDGIVWDDDRNTNTLRAFSSDSYATELYNSDQAPGGRDTLGATVKFEVDTVANGHVYVGVGTGSPNNFLVVYGLLPPSNGAPVAPTGLTASAVSKTQINLSWAEATGATSYNVYRGTSPGGEGATPLRTGLTTTSFSDTGLTAGPTYYYEVTAVNAAGQSGPSNEASVPTVPLAPANLMATGGNGQVSLGWTAATGAASYNVYRGTSPGGEGTTPLQTGVMSTSLNDTNVVAGTTYYYEVTAVNAAGQSGPSNEASAVPTGPNYPNGFAGATSQLTFNGYGTASPLNGGNLVLTDGGINEGRSVFFNTPVNVTSFSTQFSFVLTNAVADGFTFTIQKAGLTALGGHGGSLGYGPGGSTGTHTIGTSVAVKFDLYSNAGEGIDSTGLYQNGVAPTVPATDLTGKVDLHSGHVFNVAMTYDGTNLTVGITDTVTQQTATQTYAVNIPSVVGGNTAWVGFTGGTGGKTATQNILSWTYTGGTAQPKALASLVATGGGGVPAGATTSNVNLGTSAGGEGGHAGAGWRDITVLKRHGSGGRHDLFSQDDA